MAAARSSDRGAPRADERAAPPRGLSGAGRHAVDAPRPFLARRLLLLALVLAIVSVVIFGVVQILPGDVAVMILGTSATPEDLAALRVKLGLDRPAGLRYVDWISGAVRGDWGTSLLYQVPVRPLVLERLQQSAILAVLALAIAVPLSIGLGVLSALRRNGFLDQASAS